MPTNVGSSVSYAMPSDCVAIQVVEANKGARAKAAAEADALLTEEQLAFEAWRDSLETVPTIKVRRLCQQPSEGSSDLHRGVVNMRSMTNSKHWSQYVHPMLHIIVMCRDS